MIKIGNPSHTWPIEGSCLVNVYGLCAILSSVFHVAPWPFEGQRPEYSEEQEEQKEVVRRVKQFSDLLTEQSESRKNCRDPVTIN